MSKPKVPAPTPVIERQAYRNPVSRGSLSSSDSDANRRRRLMGVATSPQGVAADASTTKRVRMGGDDDIIPNISGAGGAPVTGASGSSGGGGTPTQGAQTGGSGANGSNSGGLFGPVIRKMLGDQMNGPFAQRLIAARAARG